MQRSITIIWSPSSFGTWSSFADGSRLPREFQARPRKRGREATAMVVSDFLARISERESGVRHIAARVKYKWVRFANEPQVAIEMGYCLRNNIRPRPKIILPAPGASTAPISASAQKYLLFGAMALLRVRGPIPKSVKHIF